MITNLKALIVVLTIAAVVFAVAKPMCLRFMTEDDFSRRRNVWFALTLTAFISPSFWLYVLVAIPLLAWSARKDTNPVALYLLVAHVIPPIHFEIPAAVVNNLFALDNYRILSFAILIPTAWRLMQSPAKAGFGRLTLMDKLIIAYVGLQLVLLMPYESVTNTLRRGFLFSIDILAMYFVVSRICTSRRALVETMASFCLACAIFAPMALFESLWRWLPYVGMIENWDHDKPLAYLFRGDLLRAQVSAGHSLSFGYLMAIAFGFSLYLCSRMQSIKLAIAVAIWMWVGLFLAYSRAPWVVAVVFFFAYLGLGPNGAVRFFTALLISAMPVGLVLASPIGARIIDFLPFVGTVDAANVAYRQKLAEVSWKLIQQNPFFGDPFFLAKMESLRQGEGIIDLVNAYATVALYSGLVGLLLFLWPVFIGLWKSYSLVRESAVSDSDLSSLGANLVACVLGTLVMMGTAGLGTGQMFYWLVGTLAGYAKLKELEVTTQGRTSNNPGMQAGWPLKRGS